MYLRRVQYCNLLKVNNPNGVCTIFDLFDFAALEHKTTRLKVLIFFCHLFSSGTLHGMCNLDKTPGNTGIMGRHFWRIENNIGKDALEKCFTWAKFQQDADFLDWYKLHIKGDSSLACPCTGWQARLDRGRFVWDWTFSAGFWCYRSRSLKLFTHSGANKTFYFVVNQQCCYSTRLEDLGSLKVGPPHGSRVKVAPIYYRRNHSQEAYIDQQAYKFCCVDRPELCDLFYFYRPSDSCSDYTPPRRRKFVCTSL